MSEHFVYILTNKPRGTLYIGVTNNLYRRINEHRQSASDTFVGKYKLHRLVYFDMTQYVYNAIAWEKKLKKWRREWKIKLIEEHNPTWRDLWKDLV